MRRTSTGMVIGCACAGAIALGGCGSSSSNSSSGALSRSQLAAKVNPLCQNLINQAKTLTPPASANDLPAIAKYLNGLTGFAQQLVTTIKGLTPDDSVKADFNAYTVSLTSNLQMLQQAASKLSANDRSGLDILNQENAANKATTRPLEVKLGFTSCETPG
jgi:hypothetical protein